MEADELTPDELAKIENDLKAADAALASSISHSCCLFEMTEFAGTFTIQSSFNGVEWIRGIVGGLAMGGSVVWGKIKISDSANVEGYSGSCAMVKVALLGAYTHVTGYDEHSHTVFKFDGGGYGIGFFSGGGTFTVKRPVG